MSRPTNMMNCDTYRQAVSADPGHNDESGHVDNCADCQAFRSDTLEMNDKINAAMAISVPTLKMPELPDLETENVVALKPRRGFSSPTWLAVAASVVLAVIIGIRSNDDKLPAIPQSGYSLAEQVLAHVDHEPEALLPTSEPVADGKLMKVVPEKIGHMNHEAGLITYAETCPVNGKLVPHLVIQGKHGPITILLLPDEEIDANQVLDGKSVYGYLLKVGSGSIAIIGDREEQLDDVKQNVLSSVAWDI